MHSDLHFYKEEFTFLNKYVGYWKRRYPPFQVPFQINININLLHNYVITNVDKQTYEKHFNA